jgi:pyruvate dehydrogenase E1 component
MASCSAPRSNDRAARSLEEWIDNCPNVDFAALTYQGGAAWRARLMADIGGKPHVRKLLDSFDDAALATLMTNLGGHCVETLIEAFDSASGDDVPTMFIAYTIKGYGLPLAGHKDNHSGMMNPPQIAELRASLGIAEGEEWDPYGGLGDNVAAELKAFIKKTAPLPPRRPSIRPPPCASPHACRCPTVPSNRRNRHSAAS